MQPQSSPPTPQHMNGAQTDYAITNSTERPPQPEIRVTEEDVDAIMPVSNTNSHTMTEELKGMSATGNGSFLTPQNDVNEVASSSSMENGNRDNTAPTHSYALSQRMTHNSYDTDPEDEQMQQQAGNGIDMEAFDAADPMEQKQMLGQALYHKVQEQEPEFVGEIIAIFLRDLDNSDLFFL